LAKLKSEPKTKLDQIREVSPKYAALLEKSAELNARFDEIVEEANGPKGRVDGVVDGKTGAVSYSAVPLAEQARRSQVAWISQAPKPVAKPVVRHSGAVALVGDLLSPQPETDLNPPPPPPSWSGAPRLAELGAESEAIQEALKLLAPELTKVRRDYSKKVAELRGGDYTERVARAVDAARELGDALQALHDFVNEARLDGVEHRYFRPLNLSQFGDLDSGPLKKLIADAIELRHTGGKLPDWKMPAPLDYLT
jgi:hypothetical protein